MPFIWQWILSVTTGKFNSIQFLIKTCKNPPLTQFHKDQKAEILKGLQKTTSEHTHGSKAQLRPPSEKKAINFSLTSLPSQTNAGLR